MSFTGQPQWRTVTVTRWNYVQRLAAPFAQRIRLDCGAVAVTRRPSSATSPVQVEARDRQGEVETFDQVVMACHGDEALALLRDADREEQSVLGAFRYQKNRAVLHRDQSLMPRRRRWASRVYTSDGDFSQPKVTVTHWMNRLQTRYTAGADFDSCEFDHPLFDHGATAAQAHMAALQGRRGIWFAGARLGHVFHEDGLASAVKVAKALGAAIPWEGAWDRGALQQKARPSVAVPANPVPAELF